MPRLAGQIDLVKTEAILDAASDVILERGRSASVDEIAHRAGVSKQTVYNHYGSKADLFRALIDKQVELISAPLEVPAAATREALTSYAEALLQTIATPRSASLMRFIIETVGANPALAREIFKTGLRAARAKLAQFLEREAAAGRISLTDANEAADFFAGMVVSHHQIHGILGLPAELTAERIERISQEGARRFLRAYAPEG